MNLVNLVSLISILLLGLLLVIFTVLLPVSIVFNTRAGMKYRQGIAEQLQRLRLGKMLTALGIDTDSYLSSERVVDIREQMQRCNSCANTDECDTQLSGGVVDADSIGYCNNEMILRKIAGQHKD
ncbi:MAG: DUF6455 family protein [Gammaproteobacteria bacterium]